MEKKTNKSKHNQPDIQQPKMFQPTSEVGRNYIHGYAKCIRNTNLSTVDLFSDVTIIDDNIIYPVPIIWGTQEKAVIYTFGEQFVSNPDRQENGLVDRIRLPIIALSGGDIQFDQSRYTFHEARRRGGPTGKGIYNQEKKPFDTVYRFSKGIPVNISYTLTIWAKYYEHLMQMVEQILLKFSPIAYIKPEGIPWETIIKLENSSSNVNDDVGDRQERILKYVFSLTAESYIIQPVKRDKTVLSIKQKYVVLGDLTPSGEIENITEEVEDGEIPNKN